MVVGTVARRRLPADRQRRRVHVIARAATPVVRRWRQRPHGTITLALRDFRDGDLDGAWYVIAATDGPAVNAAVVAGPDRRHIFCVAPTQPATAL